MGRWGRAGRLAGLMLLAAATTASAEPDATIDSITLHPMSCTFDVVFTTTEASTYAVNLWDDGTYIGGAGGTYAANSTVTVRVTIGGPTLEVAAGIGVYVEEAVGPTATTTYDSNGSYAYPAEVGNACQVLGFMFGVEVTNVVEPTTTTTTTTTSTTTTSTTTTTLLTQFLPGARLLIAPTKLVLVAKDKSLTVGSGPGSNDDPTVMGGSLRVVGTGFDQTYDLAPSAWRYLSEKRHEKGYRLSNASPITAVTVKKGKGLKLVAKGDLAMSLDADLKPVQVQLRLGQFRHCMTFGGTILWKAGTKWQAKKAPTADSCPP